MHRLRALLAIVFLSALPVCLAAQTEAPANTSSSLHSSYGEKLHIQGIRNSGKINDHLYRGAQPKPPGLLELKKIGITMIVDLRAEDRSKANWEQNKAESLGMRFVHIPVGGWSPPTNDQVAQFLSIFRENPQEKVFVHCHFGDDRTGVFVAAYRMAFDKFLSDEALHEMYLFGFNGAWHPSMATFVHDFPAQLNTAPSLAPFKPTR
jgi:protein tyrosine phosphatase (PTP) superfamily phosphohydrolase (DUF442 family)